MRVFVQSFAHPPRMLVFGAIDYAAAVARIGSFLGYRVTVCDARPLFATPDRFPGAAEVVADWPHRYLHREAEAGNLDSRTVVCVLTHDPKFDVPTLSLALRLPNLAYVGAMGSRRTHLERLERLRTAGLTDTELSRLSSRSAWIWEPGHPRRPPQASQLRSSRLDQEAPGHGCGISTDNPFTRPFRPRRSTLECHCRRARGL
jgi:XdhC Rossmann domain